MAGRRSLAEGLYVPGTSAIHRLAPQCKVAAAVLFVFAVVATPREAVWAFAIDAAVLVVLAVVARVPVGLVVRRLAIEVPFVAFALLLPIIGRGERITVAGVSLSVAGLWAAWNIVVKATLGVGASILLASTTPMAQILVGLERLRAPKVLVSVGAFMVRYVDVVVGEMQRMRVARLSRGHDPRWIWQARAVAASAGALFIRSYERGERVYLAMVSRGYDGRMPDLDHRATPSAGAWAAAMLPVVVAVSVAVAAWVVG